MPALLIRRGEVELARHELSRNRVSVGARNSCEICIDDPEVEPVHGFVELWGTEYFFVRTSGDDGARLAPGKPYFLGTYSLEVVFEETAWKVRNTDVVLQPQPGVVPTHLLVCLDGKERRIELRPELIVGADPRRGELKVDDSFLSAEHFLITRDERGLWVKDLQSTNGTFIFSWASHRKRRVESGQVDVADRIVAGHSEFIPEVVGRSDGDFGAIIGTSEIMKEVYEIVRRVAPTDHHVLILGETGTGKELFAAEVMKRSPRMGKPYVVVNSAAIASQTAESELFGHEKGSFTGSTGVHRGFFEQAHGGTLFLDEIGEMKLDLQAKLLRAVDTGVIRRVGAEEDIKVDVRVIAATNRDLHAEVEKGNFREDLLYRLAVFPLRLPPLRERTGDIDQIVWRLLAPTAPDGTAAEVTDAAWRKLRKHPWPSNVRGLKNAILRAHVLRKSHREPIDAKHISFDQAGTSAKQAAKAAEVAGLDGGIPWLGRTYKELTLDYVKRAVAVYGSQAEAEKRTGISLRTIQRILNERDDGE